MGAAGGGVMAGLGLFQAYGQATGAKAMGDYQNTMSKINSRNAEIAADDAIERGKESVNNYRKKVNQVVGSQRAGYASGGIDVGYGSAQAVQDETREIGQADVATIKNNAFLEAMGYKAQAQESSRRGRLAQQAGQNEYANTLLTGGMKAAGYLYDNYGGVGTKPKTKSKPTSEVA